MTSSPWLSWKASISDGEKRCPIRKKGGYLPTSCKLSMSWCASFYPNIHLLLRPFQWHERSFSSQAMPRPSQWLHSFEYKFSSLHTLTSDLLFTNKSCHYLVENLAIFTRHSNMRSVDLHINRTHEMYLELGVRYCPLPEIESWSCACCNTQELRRKSWHIDEL